MELRARTPHDVPGPAARARVATPAAVTVLGLVGCSALAAGTLFHRLGDKSFWLDETFSVIVARSSWSEIWDIVLRHEANMGLYYFVLHAWLAVGESEAAVRALSAAFGIAAVAVLFGLVRRLFGPGAALLAAAFLATNALFVEHGQNARGYALATLAFVLATYVFVRAVEAPASRWWWAAYVAAATLAVYSHFYAVFVIAAHLAAVPFSPAAGRRRELSLVCGAVVLLAAPLGLFTVLHDQGQVDWIPPPGFFMAIDTWFTMVGASTIWFNPTLLTLLGAFFALVVVAAAVAQVVAGLAGRMPRTPDTWKHVLLAAWLVVPLLASFALSFAKPIFHPRYFVLVTPALAALLAVSLLGMERRRVAVAVAGALFAASTANLGVLHREGSRDHENWRGVAGYVLDRHRPGDAIVFFDPYVHMAFDHYAAGDHAGRDRPRPLFRYEGVAFTGTMVPSHWGPLQKSQAPRIWLVLSHNLDAQRETRRIRRMLGERRERVSRRYFKGVRVELYRLR